MSVMGPIRYLPGQAEGSEVVFRGRDLRKLSLGEMRNVRGRDQEHGRITYFVDVNGLPVQGCWHDMKFWWPQNETIIATLLAYRLMDYEKYARWRQMIHDWTYARFPNLKHGEWYGYLHPDGRLSSHLKGNTHKGAFHVRRMKLMCWKLMAEMQN